MRRQIGFEIRDMWYNLGEWRDSGWGVPGRAQPWLAALGHLNLFLLLGNNYSSLR